MREVDYRMMLWYTRISDTKSMAGFRARIQEEGQGLRTIKSEAQDYEEDPSSIEGVVKVVVLILRCRALGIFCSVLRRRVRTMLRYTHEERETAPSRASI